jgi:hypothetical protein
MLRSGRPACGPVSLLAQESGCPQLRPESAFFSRTTRNTWSGSHTRFVLPRLKSGQPSKDRLVTLRHGHRRLLDYTRSKKDHCGIPLSVISTQRPMTRIMSPLKPGTVQPSSTLTVTILDFLFSKSFHRGKRQNAYYASDERLPQMPR